MANISGAGNTWNLPNYAGDLFTADMTSTPFFSMIGGLTGGRMTDNFEFPVSSEYSQQTASQPDITETDSLTAPTAVSYVRNQNKNVTQIFQEKFSLSYVKESNYGRMSGLNSGGQENNVISEKDFQIAKALEKIARDIEYTCLNGVYQISTGTGVANKTRGILSAISTNTIAAASATLTKAIMDSLFLTMFNNGAQFRNMVIFCGGFQKQKLSGIYGYAPQDRNVGGVNIKQIETDFGNIGVADPHRLMPAGTLLVADMSVVAPVFQPVPKKGNFFYEDLGKSGASDDGQIFGQFGLAHGPEWMHGKITGLATS
jgi:hypothetical protein